MRIQFHIQIDIKADNPRRIEIELFAEDWNSPVVSDFFSGPDQDVWRLKEYLNSEAMCMYGHTFSLENYTPRQLYEALSGLDNSSFITDPEFSPEQDEALPDGAVY